MELAWTSWAWTARSDRRPERVSEEGLRTGPRGLSGQRLQASFFFSRSETIWGGRRDPAEHRGRAAAGAAQGAQAVAAADASTPRWSGQATRGRTRSPRRPRLDGAAPGPVGPSLTWWRHISSPADSTVARRDSRATRGARPWAMAPTSGAPIGVVRGRPAVEAITTRGIASAAGWRWPVAMNPDRRRAISTMSRSAASRGGGQRHGGEQSAENQRQDWEQGAAWVGVVGRRRGRLTHRTGAHEGLRTR